MKPRTAGSIAREIHAWVENVCMELAAETHAFHETTIDVQADNYYNDPDSMDDLLIGRIHDDCRGDRELMQEVITELQRSMPHLPYSFWNSLRRNPWFNPSNGR
jgi:hypothetical protein